MIYVALFRGINVGGNNILPMKVLVAILERIGLEEVKTYIQSGNVVFRSDVRDKAKLEGRIASAVHGECGFKPRILLITKSEFRGAIEANPYPQATAEPKSLHLFFLSEAPVDPDIPGMERLRLDSESYSIVGAVLYLHTTTGIGRSKLAAKIESLVGVPITARNWRTVTKIAELTEKTD